MIILQITGMSCRLCQTCSRMTAGIMAAGLCSLLVASLIVAGGVGEARSTFSAQQLQDLWPYFQESQPSSFIPLTGEKQTFVPERTRLNGDNDNEEPLSRDLDIGFTVSDTAQDQVVGESRVANPPVAPRGGYRDEHRDGNEFLIDVLTDRRKLASPFSRQPSSRYEVQSDDYEPMKWREDWAPRNQIRREWVPVHQWLGNSRAPLEEVPVADLLSDTLLQDRGSALLGPTVLEEGSTAGRGAYPALIAQPLMDRVGTMRLKSDRGYQLAMRVPPVSSGGGDRPGILEMDMKATLLRPIYY